MKLKESASTYGQQKRKFTIQDYLNLPDDGKLYQLIEGELVMSPSPTPLHQLISSNLEAILREFVKSRRLGQVFHAPLDVVLSKHNVFQPDILFISRDRLSIITEQNIQGAPDLVIEILSPGSFYYDWLDKKAVYERYGVKEYWLVDPLKHWVEVYALREGQFHLHQKCEQSGNLTSALLPEFSVSLSAIFNTEI